MMLEDDIAMVRSIDDQHIFPEIFQESWNHIDLQEHKFWRDAIRKNFKVMIKICYQKRVQNMSKRGFGILQKK